MSTAPDPRTHPLARVAIRPPEESDRAVYIDARRSSLELHRPWESTSAHRPVPGSDEEFNRVLARSRSDALMRLAFLTDGGDLVGQSAVMPISPGPPGSAYLGYWASQAHAGRGLMRETLALALHEAFTDAGLHRVEANIVPDNERSVRLAESLGMRHEGVALEYLEISGEMRDHAHYALLRREWLALGDDPVGTLLSGRR